MIEEIDGERRKVKVWMEKVGELKVVLGLINECGCGVKTGGC